MAVRHYHEVFSLVCQDRFEQIADGHFRNGMNGSHLKMTSGYDGLERKRLVIINGPGMPPPTTPDKRGPFNDRRQRSLRGFGGLGSRQGRCTVLREHQSAGLAQRYCA